MAETAPLSRIHRPNDLSAKVVDGGAVRAEKKKEKRTRNGTAPYQRWDKLCGVQMGQRTAKEGVQRTPYTYTQLNTTYRYTA